MFLGSLTLSDFLGLQSRVSCYCSDKKLLASPTSRTILSAFGQVREEGERVAGQWSGAELSLRLRWQGGSNTVVLMRRVGKTFVKGARRDLLAGLYALIFLWTALLG